MKVGCEHPFRVTDGVRSMCGRCGETLGASAAAAGVVTVLSLFAALGRRFAGIDLQHRRDTKATGWPHEWRAQLLTTKNERDDYRLTAFGATAIEAMSNLLAKVASVDAKSAAEFRAMRSQTKETP